MPFTTAPVASVFLGDSIPTVTESAGVSSAASRNDMHPSIFHRFHHRPNATAFTAAAGVAPVVALKVVATLAEVFGPLIIKLRSSASA